MTRMGRFIIVSGGNRFPAPLSSIEVLNTRKPEKWRTLSKLTLPNPTYDHCSVAVNKTTMFVTGGFGQESQAYMMDLLNKNYKAEASMKQPRRSVSFSQLIFTCSGTPFLVRMLKYRWRSKLALTQCRCRLNRSSTKTNVFKRCLRVKCV